jgi:hypothetical protein
MKKEKQELFIKIMANGKYKIDTEAGIVYSFRKGTESWAELKPNKPVNGYFQYIFHLGRGLDTKVIVYGHVAVWIAANGIYEEGLEVNHKDLDKRNNGIKNLELATSKENHAHAMANNACSGVKKEVQNVLIKFEQIQNIKFYLRGGVTNYSDIARRIGASRCATMRIVKKIKAGQPLKYENGNSVPSPRNKVLNALKLIEEGNSNLGKALVGGLGDADKESC